MNALTSSRNHFDINGKEFLSSCSKYGLDSPFPFIIDFKNIKMRVYDDEASNQNAEKMKQFFKNQKQKINKNSLMQESTGSQIMKESNYSGMDMGNSKKPADSNKI